MTNAPSLRPLSLEGATCAAPIKRARDARISLLWSAFAVGAVVVIALLSTKMSAPTSAQAPHRHAVAPVAPATHVADVTPIVISVRRRAIAPEPTAARAAPRRASGVLAVKPRAPSAPAARASRASSAEVNAAAAVLAQAQRESSL